MELHHKLRRDPSWHPNACNICGELGHQAANCTNGTINWKSIYGEDAFVLKEPVYWSEVQEKRKLKKVDVQDLEKKAREFAKLRMEAQGINYDEMTKQAQAMLGSSGTTDKPAEAPAAVEKKEEAPLPAGWAVAHDANNRPYYWHKKTQKTMWERPTEETPAE